MKRTITLMTLAAMTAITNAASISVSFGGDGNGTDPDDSLITGGAAAGVTDQTNWINGLGNTNNTGVTNDGLTVTWASAESWSQSTTDSTGDTQLLAGWIGTLTNAGLSTVSVTGLNSSLSYDIYLYSGTDRPNQINTFTETNGAFTPVSSTEDIQTATLTSSLVFVEGTNYVKATVTGVTDLNIEWNAPSENRSSLAGIEVIEATTIPEPSSTALLGLGGLALILRRRK